MQRKLAAIVYADVAGYSRLTSYDEKGTHEVLKDRLGVLTKTIDDYGGRICHFAGDAVLAEFSSVVTALECAVTAQRDFRGRNKELPDNEKLQFRIGVNLGDVIADGDEIYGNGVNVAARLEALANPGGICISDRVQEQVEDKLDVGFTYLGPQSVKNIKKPINVYRVLLDRKDAGRIIGAPKIQAFPWGWATAAVLILIVAAGGWATWLHVNKPEFVPASIDKMAFPSPDKPSIAVLPFTNMSGDKEQEYFADGMTDDLITDLSKISGLFVIARNSAFVYKGKAVKIEDVGRELGVRYVLEGSIRKANQRVRITAQLVDTFTDGHLWAERYDRDLKDIFSLQDEVTQKIVEALAVTLTEDEQERLVRRYTDNIEAYDYYLRGWEYFGNPTREENVQAREMHQRAIDLDPEFAAAHALLAFTYSQEWTMGWSQDPRTFELAFELAERAIELDESLPLGHAILAEVYLWKKKHEKAIAAQNTAIALSPNDADQIAGLAGILTWAGRPDETVELIKKAMRLNPMYPIEYLWNLGHANYLLGRLEDAIEALKRISDRNPDYLPAHAYLGASYSELGWGEKARTEAAEVNRLAPGASIETWRQRLPYKDQAALERVVHSLRKAGLK